MDELNREEQAAVSYLVKIIRKLQKKEFPDVALFAVINMYAECLDEAINERKKKRK